MRKNNYVVYGNGQVGRNFLIRHKTDNVKYILDRKVAVGQSAECNGIKVFNPDDYIQGEDFIVIAVMDWLPIAIWLESLGKKFWKDFIPYTLIEDPVVIDFRLFLLSSFDIRLIAGDKKIAICYGLCHMKVYRMYLCGNREFYSKYVFIDTPTCTEISNPEYEFHKLLISNLVWGNCDLLLSVEMKAAQGLSDNKLVNINSLLKKDCQTVIITAAQFRGYFPQAISGMSNLINRKLYPYFCWGDKFINRLSKEGNNAPDILRIVCDSNFLSRSKVKDFMQSSLENLKMSEIECDIRISDYIADNYKHRLLYYSGTHPADEVMREITLRILRYINIQDDNIDCAPILLDNHEMPIYKSVADGLDLEFDVINRMLKPGDAMEEKISTAEYFKMYVDKWNALRKVLS